MMEASGEARDNETTRDLFAFVTGGAEADLERLRGNGFPLKDEDRIEFELYGLRVFTADYLLYMYAASPEHRARVSGPLFEELKRWADERWPGEGIEAIAQRLSLYAHAARQHDGHADVAIMNRFCRLCGHEEEAFMSKVPEVFLGYLQTVQAALERPMS
ncbi:hypothetical protein ABEV74_11495 [Paenibacillus cisolokensis]|uniref:hypothetical protein n=1 Tax=Paenibacillus cisolokensis TaxID=1658519 RepID=UPI003D2A8D12